MPGEGTGGHAFERLGGRARQALPACFSIGWLASNDYDAVLTRRVYSLQDAAVLRGLAWAAARRLGKGHDAPWRYLFVTILAMLSAGEFHHPAAHACLAKECAPSSVVASRRASSLVFGGLLPL